MILIHTRNVILMHNVYPHTRCLASPVMFITIHYVYLHSWRLSSCMMFILIHLTLTPPTHPHTLMNIMYMYMINGTYLYVIFCIKGYNFLYHFRVQKDWKLWDGRIKLKRIHSRLEPNSLIIVLRLDLGCLRWDEKTFMLDFYTLPISR